MRNTLKKYSALSIVLVLLLLIAANAVMGGFSASKGAFWDLTRDGTYTLSAETKSVLSHLNEEIYVYAIYDATSENRMINKLLDSYDGSSLLNIEKLDPVANKGVVDQYNVSDDSREYVVVTNRDNTTTRVISEDEMYVTAEDGSRTRFKGEQKLTSAINYVATGVERHVALLSGHGEKNASEVSSLLTSLGNLDYELKAVDRDSLSLDPKNDVLLILSPQSDITAAEAEDINEFLNDGGRAIVMTDRSGVGSDGGIVVTDAAMPNLASVLRSFGLTVNDDLIVSGKMTESCLRSTRLLIDDDTGEGGVVLGECSTITAAPANGVTVTSLLSTSASCHTKSIKSGAPSSLKLSSTDKTGPFSVGVLSEKGEGKLALFTSGAFVSDSEISIMGNRSLILNLIDRLSRKEDTVTIASKSLVNEKGITAGGITRLVYVFIFVILMPAAILAAGLVMWNRRVTRKSAHR